MNTTYEFYVETFGGSLVLEEEFDPLIRWAEQVIDQNTFGRMPADWSGESWEKLAKCAACELAEYRLECKKREGMKSESSDGYSVTYEDADKSDKNIYKIVQTYLMNTGLLSMEV